MDAGTPLPYIQRVVGHKDIKTMIYMHITKQKFEDYDTLYFEMDMYGCEVVLSQQK